jgi:hypothetical protein
MFLFHFRQRAENAVAAENIPAAQNVADYVSIQTVTTRIVTIDTATGTEPHRGLWPLTSTDKGHGVAAPQGGPAISQCWADRATSPTRATPTPGRPRPVASRDRSDSRN